MLVPFVFNSNESYILEFGGEYVRFVRNGAQVPRSDTPIIASHDVASPAGSQALTTAAGLSRAQRFVSSSTVPFSIREIRVRLGKLFVSSPTVRVAVYSDAAGLPDAPLTNLGFLDFTSVSASQLLPQPVMKTFSLVDPTAPLPIIPVGTPLHIVVQSDSSSGLGHVFISCTTGDQHPTGAAFTNLGGVWTEIVGVDLRFEVSDFVSPGPMEIETTYLENEVREIKGRTAQSADVLFIPHRAHNPAELKRYAEQSWALSDLINGPQFPAPVAPTITGDLAGDVNNPLKSWWYVVTAIDAATGSESFGSIPKNISINVSTIKPATVTIPTAVAGASGYNIYRGRNYGVYGYIGSIDGLVFYDDAQVPDYTVVPIPDPAYTATPDPTLGTPGQPFLSQGGAPFVQNSNWYSISAVDGVQESFGSVPRFDGVARSPSAATPVNVRLHVGVTGATGYRVYRGVTKTQLGLIGTMSGLSFADTGNAPNYSQQPLFKAPFQAPGPPPISFDTEGDRPSVAAFYDQRLILAGTDNKPDTFFGSRAGNYRDFVASSPAGDDDAFEYTLGALTVDRILGLVHARVLMGFTGSSEYAIQGSRGAPIGPASIDAKAHAHYGSGSIAPLPVGGRVLFSQLEGPAIREFRFDFQQDGYTAEDERSVLAKHLLEGHTIIDWAYAKGPDSVIWMVRDDGVLLGMTYLPSHEVIAWHQHDTDGFYESVACIPEGDETAVYVVVRRTVDGSPKRFIERFASRSISNTPNYGVFLDCSLTYRSPDFAAAGVVFSIFDNGWLAGVDTVAGITGLDYFVASHVGSQIVWSDAAGNEYRATILVVTSGTSVTIRFQRDVPPGARGPLTVWTHALSVFSFPHLGVGREVSAVVDGGVVTDLTVDGSGNVTLPHAGSVVTIGLPYTSTLETLDINFDGRSMQTVKKILGRVWFEVVASRGLWIGEDGRMREWKQRKVADGAVNAGAAMPLATQRDYVTISGGWGTSGRVTIEQRDPLPCEITSITPEVTFGG